MGTGRARYVLYRLIVTALLVLSLACILPSQGAMAQLEPTTVEIVLSPDEGHVDMGPQGNGSATFTGTISVTTLPFVVTTVNVTVEVGDWINDTDQSNFVITGNRAAEFTVNVYAPYNATSDDEKVVKVITSWSTTLGETGVEDDTAVAVVDQFYRVNIYAPKTYIAGKRGERLKMDAYVSNTGNGRDSFTLKLTNVSNLEKSGWKFSLSKDKLFLDADEKGMVEVDIEIPDDAAYGLYTYMVNATSESAPDLDYATDDVPIRIRVKEETTNGGNGGNGGGNGDDDKPKYCSTEMIPLFLMAPLGATMFTVRRYKGRRPA